MGQGKVITMEDAHRAGLGEIFDRVLVELVGKMEEMKMVSLYIFSQNMGKIENFYFSLDVKFGFLRHPKNYEMVLKKLIIYI